MSNWTRNQMGRVALVALAVAAFFSAGRAQAQITENPIPTLQLQSPTLEGTIRSTEAARGTSIQFNNASNFEVDIYWLDFEGRRVLYATLAPQQTLLQHTFVSHPWLVVRREDSRPLGIFEATLSPSWAVVRNTNPVTWYLPVQSPGSAPELRSRTLGGATAIEFRNVGPEPVQIFWLDFEGKRVPYATLQQNQGYTQETFLGHIWLLADHNGKAVAIVESTTSGGIAAFAFDIRP